MDALPELTLLKPATIAEAVAARAAHPASRPLGGGTDLLVNLRRGIVAPPVLIDMTDVAELREIHAGGERLAIGASVTLAALAQHATLRAHYPVVAEAAASIAGPTQREMGTLGGNLCLDTRCIYYNQSDWWRSANDHCLKTTGTVCHVAPKSRGVCFATFSGDLAPALMVLNAEVELAGPAGRRSLPLAQLYIGHARHDGAGGDGKNYLALAPGEIVTGVRAPYVADLRSGYDKIAFDARSNIPWRAWRRRSGARAIRSSSCASPLPARTHGRCCSKARRSFAAGRSRSMSLPGSTTSCATRSWQ